MRKFADASFPWQAVSPFMPCMPHSMKQSYGVQTQGFNTVLHHDAPLLVWPVWIQLVCLVWGGPSLHHTAVHLTQCMVMTLWKVMMMTFMNRERIPIQPGDFDGSGSWKDFLYQFEICARANHWSTKIMAVQLWFSLTVAAGSIHLKNPRSSQWSYQWILVEIEAAYRQCSEHAAINGIKLRQRIRVLGEALHRQRDDIWVNFYCVFRVFGTGAGCHQCGDLYQCPGRCWGGAKATGGATKHLGQNLQNRTQV